MLADDSHIDECAPGGGGSGRGIVPGWSGEGGWGSKAGGWAVMGLVGCVGWAW